MGVKDWALLDTFRNADAAKPAASGLGAPPLPLQPVSPGRERAPQASRRTYPVLDIESVGESRGYPYALLRRVLLRSDSRLELHFDDEQVTILGKELRHLYQRVIAQERGHIGIDPPASADIAGVSRVAEIGFSQRQ